MTFQHATSELQQIRELLVCGDDLDPSILAEFRDAVNRVRTAAWAAQQYVASKTAETGSNTVFSVLAGERIRAMYQLCKAIQTDLGNAEIRFQRGPLMQLRSAMQEALAQVSRALGE